MRTKHSTQPMSLITQNTVLGKSQRILKKILKLVLIIGGQNQESDGKGKSLRQVFNKISA